MTARKELPAPPAVIYLDLESCAPNGEVAIPDEDQDDLYYDMQETAEQELVSARYAHSRRSACEFYGERYGSDE